MPADPRRVSVLERREDLQRALLNVVLAGGGVVDVVARLAEAVGGAVLATTADGRVLAESGEAGLLAALHASPAFHESGRFRTETEPRGVHRVDGVPGTHAVVAISGGGIDHGRLLAADATRILGEDDLALVDRAADVAALCLTQQMAVTAVESRYRGDFLRDVLSGRAGSADEVGAHAAVLGWDLDRPLAVVVAALETEGGPPLSRGYRGPLELERFAATWATVLGRSDPTAPVVGYAAEVVALVPVGTDASRRDVDVVVRGVRGDGGGGRRPFAAGVSRVADGVVGLPAAYQQALKALHAGRRLHDGATVVHFDDLGVFRLLSLIDDPGELDAFVAETLGALAPGGGTDPRRDEEAAALRTTLATLLDTNLNVAETARLLHFHYNTLRYRIGKIERAVGPFTADANLRLDLALALRIIALRDL